MSNAFQCSISLTIVMIGELAFLDFIYNKLIDVEQRALKVMRRTIIDVYNSTHAGNESIDQAWSMTQPDVITFDNTYTWLFTENFCGIGNCNVCW